MTRCFLALLGTCLAVSDAAAHYNMLLLDSPYAKKGAKVAFVYQWGHPFEHELFDAPPPARLIVLTPDGKKQDLVKTLEKIEVAGAGKKKVHAYRFFFTPEQRGDHTFILSTPPILLEESGEFVQDIVKTVLHVSTQQAWDADPGRQFKIMPLTRPYGLLPGMVFRAQVLLDQVPGEVSDTALPLRNAVVEFERYNAAALAEVPIDELITFKAKTDHQGMLAISFPEPGWWCVATQRDAGTREHGGRRLPLRQRVILWLHVDGKK